MLLQQPHGLGVGDVGKIGVDERPDAPDERGVVKLNAISSGHLAKTYFSTYFIISLASSISSSRSAKAISGSTIQNSAAWRGVLEFSALKVGPKVYILPKAIAMHSPSSWPETVRLTGLPKKSLE
jgi:hypothetical protein